MSVDEIRVRTKGVLRRRYERHVYRHGSGRSSKKLNIGLADELRATCTIFVPGSRDNELSHLRHTHPAMYRAMACRAQETADQIMSAPWALLGHPVRLQGEVDWHRDPRSGHRWPRVFYADVPLHQEDRDDIDIKYVWELGRHQYLVELARGWLFTGNKRYAERTRALLLDFIEQNPLYEGVHWTSALEAAMRMISWLWTLATLAGWDGWKQDDLRRIAQSLVDHGTYVEHHLSFYSSPYNHLIGEATALYLVGLWLAGVDAAPRWEALGRRVLCDHGPKQFYNDGFCVEQAMGYHFYTLGFLILAIIAARSQGEALGDVEESAHRAFRAAMHFRQPDGRWPVIGDVDSARSIPVQPGDFWNFNGLCSLAAVIFEDPALKLPDSKPGDELYWLLGADGLQGWHDLPESDPTGFTVLPESGYAVGRQGGDWFCLDAGPIAHGLHADAVPSATHGHLDTLQILYCHKGEPIFVDSGMPFYFGSREWVHHFRSAGAHSTVEIEGLPLARDAGRLKWSHVKYRSELRGGSSEQVWTAVGRVDWPNGATLQRHLAYVPGTGLWIADIIQLDRPRRVRWFWQLGQSIQMLHRTGQGPLACVGDAVLATWLSTGKTQVSLECASEGAPVGWRGPGYGHSSPGRRMTEVADGVRHMLKVTYVGPSPCTFHFAVADGFVAHQWDENRLDSLRCRSGEATWRFLIDARDFSAAPISSS